MLLHERKMKVVIDVNLNHAGGPDVNASDAASVSVLRPRALRTTYYYYYYYHHHHHHYYYYYYYKYTIL